MVVKLVNFSSIAVIPQPELFPIALLALLMVLSPFQTSGCSFSMYRFPQYGKPYMQITGQSAERRRNRGEETAAHFIGTV